jgi:Fe-S-cluster-containing dehydrogenase component
MSDSRRSFLKQITGAAAGTVCSRSGEALAAEAVAGSDPLGVLVDTSLCVGCRRCEAACNEINEDLPRRSPASFEDETSFGRRRRMDDSAYTVVNRYPNPNDAERPVYAKFQCMHCLQPACVSACIVGALSRQSNGAVTYDPQKCIGCRYCMVACPFQVPAYEYRNSFAPKVRKCHFCFEKRLAQGSVPACVEACPMQIMTFGRRIELIQLAEDKLGKYPDRYVPHLYGAHEVGGTAWMYMSSIPFRDIDLPEFGYHPVPGYTEPVQHILFKWMLPPLGLYAILGGIMWFMESRRKQQSRDPDRPD